MCKYVNIQFQNAMGLVQLQTTAPWSYDSINTQRINIETQIAKNLGSTSIRHRSDTFKEPRIDID